MLREYWVIRIALCAAITGLILLAFYSNSAECVQKTIGDISKEDIGKKISVFGRVRLVEEKANILLLEVYDGNYINIAIFNDGQKNIAPIFQDDLIEICGNVSKYKNKLEIIAELVKVV